MTVFLAAMRARIPPWVAVLVGVALTLPALHAGLFADDYLQRSILLGVGTAGAGARPMFDMFAFVPTGPRLQVLMDLGTLTWWAHPELAIALFRPLSVLTHVLDYALWPNNIAVQHLHSILWFAVAVFAVAALYRKLHGATVVAGLAAVLFAVEDAHALCVGWLANRHAVITLVMGVAALHAHIRWRRGGGARWAGGAIGAFALALFCGESALGVLAYIVAWQATMDDAGRRGRATALLPYLLVVIAWRILYEHLGYGTHGSALYIDPGHQPVDFLLALMERWPLLNLAQWLQFPVDLVLVLSRTQQILVAGFAVLVCVGLGALFGPLIVRQRRARFWALGMSLSMVPVCAAFPMDRLLLFAGIGAFGLLAMFAEESGWLSASGMRAPSWRRFCARGLLVLHGPVAALLLVVRVATIPLFGALVEFGTATVTADENAPRQTYVFVTGHEFPVVYLAIIRQLQMPATAPKRVALLAPMTGENVVYRESADTLVIDARGGFLRSAADRLLRSLDQPFRVGERIERADFVAEVRSVTEDNRPLSVAFHFRAPLESARFRWFAYRPDGAFDFVLPRVGERVTLPRVSLIPGVG